MATSQTDIEILFPKLKETGYRRTSPVEGSYNCIAWAAGHKDRWWEPSTGYYWPGDVPQICTVPVLVAMFRALGYDVCDDGGLETDFDKIAIYGEDDGYTHAARQLDDGKWTSKLGGLEDIEHNSLDGLVGEQYGTVQVFMKRHKGYEIDPPTFPDQSFHLFPK